MAKALGTLVFRGMVGIMSIVATAVVTVLVQRYLNATAGVSVPASTSRPAQTEGGEPRSVNEPQVNSSDSPDSSVDSSTGSASEERGDPKTRIMEQFWDKLNH